MALERIEAAGVTLNMDKCKLKFFRHIVSKESIRAYPEMCFLEH